ncbi:hypothetical protein LOC67_09005 [Stieleria sp. JC731]|uniref:hypothetical protein n=1 Tax=Pirellulaceae TaxID=2691357 RepID=UPI001E36B0C5|nr:hypothetical protein [Stieleria sp. JC731]MCC9600700.1 hypothetical protein [Stieleria sp. JC731]
MDKYYLSCGDVRQVISARDSLSAMQRLLEDLLGEWMSRWNDFSEITVSKRGFDSSESFAVDTLSVIFCTSLASKFGLNQLFDSIRIQTEPATSTRAPADSRESKLTFYPLDHFPVKPGDETMMMRSWAVAGHGTTVHVWQVDEQPLFIDVYSVELDNFDDIISSPPRVELKIDSTDQSEQLFAALSTI